MSTILINSREVLEILEESGINKKQARAITKAMETIDPSHLVTKVDMANLKADLIKFMFLQSIGIIGLTVALLKFMQ